MSSKRALIILNGDIGRVDATLRDRRRYDLVIAADGAVHGLPVDYEPMIICGDFDSISTDTARTRFPKAEVIELPDQNSSDMEKALKLARDRGAESVTLIAAIGGRVDHSIASLSVLVAHHRDIDITIVDDRSEVWVVSPQSHGGNKMVISTRENDIVSLIALSTTANVTIEAVEWPLDRQTLNPGAGGISNRALATSVPVTVHEGIVCVCHLDSTWAEHYISF